MRLSRPSRRRPSRLWRRRLGVVLILPLILTTVLLAPARAVDTPSEPVGDIDATGTYASGGPGCHGTDDVSDCLTWNIEAHYNLAIGESTTIAIEADSQPGQWTWDCPSGDRVAGTATYFYHDPDENGPLLHLDSSGLGLNDQILDGRGRSAGSVTGITCTPEHLSMTYEPTFPDPASYVDLSVGARAVAPGTGERDYTFAPTVTSSQDGVPRSLTATAKKPDAGAVHASVTASPQTAAGASKDAGRYTVAVRNDSTSALSDFTIATSRKRGLPSFTGLSCDLTAYGGEVVTAEGPAESLSVSSGGASVPGGQEVICQVDATGISGANTLGASVTAAGQTFEGYYDDNRPDGEVTVQNKADSVQVQPSDDKVGSTYVRVDYEVAFRNRTNVNGETSPVVLRPHVPAGLTLEYVSSDTGWPISGRVSPQADGTIPVSEAKMMSAHTMTPLQFSAYYAVDAGAVTEDGWGALGACVPGDPSTGLTTQVDVVGNDAGVGAGTYSTCTAVVRPQ